MEFEAKVLAAQLENDVRLHPDKHNMKTVTDKGAASAVLRNPKYIAAYGEYLEAQAEADLLLQAVLTMDQKKWLIEDLCKLHAQQYFAGPSVPNNLAALWAGHREKESQALNERMATKARKRVTRGSQ